MKATPVPLFNYKKRQRQAIVSDPQTLSSACASAPRPVEDGNTVHSFQTTRGGGLANSRLPTPNSRLPTPPNSSTSRVPAASANFSTNIQGNNMSNNRNSSFEWGKNRPGNPTNSASSNIQSSSKTTVTAQPSGWMGSRGGSSGLGGQQRGLYGRSSNQSPVTSGFGNAPVKSQANNARWTGSSGSHPITSHISQAPSANRGGGLMANSRRGVGRQNPAQLQQLRMMPSPSTTSASSLRGKSPAAHTGRSGSGPNTSGQWSAQGLPRNFASGSRGRGDAAAMSGRGQSREQPTKSDLRGSRSNSSLSRPQTYRSGGMANSYGDTKLKTESFVSGSTQPQTNTGRNTTKPRKPGPVKPDMSMRVLTCSIAGMKNWCSSDTNTGLVLFEIYGIVDSATVRDRSGTAKEFLMRDDTSSIKCIFYEIDRELPRLIRGHVHRAVGSVDTKRGMLKVVSMRPAEKEEKQVCQTCSKWSQIEMNALMNEQ